jgi:hypothetical protein
MKYQKLPVVVEAERWFPDNNIKGVKPYYGEGFHAAVAHTCRICGYDMSQHSLIDALKGEHIVCPGDYIITGIKGEKYPCKPDIFETTHGPYYEDDLREDPKDRLIDRAFRCLAQIAVTHRHLVPLDLVGDTSTESYEEFPDEDDGELLRVKTWGLPS